MEKRLLIAFLVSFVFLALWNSLTPKSSPKPLSAVDAPMASVVKDVPPAAKSPVSLVKEKSVRLENGFLEIDVSNYGAMVNDILLTDYGARLPLRNLFLILDQEQDAYHVDFMSDHRAVMSLEKNGVLFKKTYTLSGEYAMTMDLEVVNQSDRPSTLDINLNGFTLDINRVDNGVVSGRDHGLLEYSIASAGKVFRKNNAVHFKEGEQKQHIKNARWLGFRNRYFCAIVKPEFDQAEARSVVYNEKELALQNVLVGNYLAPGQSRTFTYDVYYGPQNEAILKSYGKGFEEIFAFSNFGILNVISKIINNSLFYVNKVVNNWGLSVVIISFLIYALLYPLSVKSAISMRKMQILQPKISELKEKYKSDPQRMNKEVLDLYKEKKVNPFSGCLPLIFQMPIFIGLYQVLWRSISLKGVSFLWMRDLAEPDRLVVFPLHLPIIGNEFNILPIIIAVLMFLQQRVTSKNIVSTDPNQQMQQKMMGVFMPIFLGFIFYKFPSGLCIYFTVFYALSTLTQWKMSKMKLD